MSQQAKALGSSTLSRMADTVHEGLTEMRGTTAPRLLLELVCARMLLPATDGSAAATLQRLERLERRMSIAGEHAGRPPADTAEPAPRPPAREAPEVREVRETPSAPVHEAAQQAPERPSAAGRREFVRPSQRSSAPAEAAPAARPAPAAADDDWPATVAPGSAAPAAPAAPAAAAAPVAAEPPGAAEPDIPLPPEPTDDEGWPQPARPAPAAESSPAPRGAEPTPVVSAEPDRPDDGELTTADVRRVWPELLAVVKRHKRTTEALLKNAQVHELKNGVLTLSTSSPALARRIGDDLNKDVLREALNELLGVRWKVEAVVEGAGRPAGGPPVAPEAARAAAREAEAAEARELMAERAAEESDADTGERPPAVDPEEAALSLLRAQLGARPVDD
jgi:DNA polymerase-3 subunit gamma/tau